MEIIDYPDSIFPLDYRDDAEKEKYKVLAKELKEFVKAVLEKNASIVQSEE